MTAQKCTPCPAGSYSLGSGIRFDEWDNIPPGFSLATYLDHSPSGEDGPACNGSSWTAQGSYVESNRDECSVALVYAVHLKKLGSVSFDYQYVDNNILFEFFIQNDQCQELEKSGEKWMKQTGNGQWGKHVVNLKSGTNVLYWRTTGVALGAKVVKPVLLKNVQIEGVAYMSECLPCKPGMFSGSSGSSSCEPCPRNTYSGRGASSCTPCNTSSHYALEAAAVCEARPACSESDYFQIHSVCDDEGQTQILYKWIEPKICLETPGAVALPPSGKREPCPPCNPGFYNNNTAVCLPCPQGMYSDGLTECQTCAAGTEPALGYKYIWWNVLPANMKSSCFNVANTKCDDMNGWEVSGDHIRSAAGGSDNDYLILNLKVPGFRLPTSVSGTSGTEFGRITFVFETICSADCELYFMMDTDRRNTNVVESWEGRKEKQSYMHIMTKNASVSYTWAFQRTNQAKDVRRYVNDMAKIYSITVTNAVDGQAAECRPCAVEWRQPGSACVPCPAGHYIDEKRSRCQECPPNTFLSGHHVYGLAACQPCGPGSRSDPEHRLCFSDCLFTHTELNQTLQFDFSPLGSTGSIMNGPSFTSKGTKYYHLFNISLCGPEGHRPVMCADNVTDLSDKASMATVVEAFICQSTIIPSEGRGFRAALSSQSVSLADSFLGATVEKSLRGVASRAELFHAPPTRVPDVSFFYRSRQTTASCERGRNTVVTLRCNPEKSAEGEISVPRECPAGTCDGCTFYFLWESSNACPRCTEADYHPIEGACRGGVQDIVYVWSEQRLCSGGRALPVKRSVPCEALGVWLKLGAGVGVFCAVLLLFLTYYFWKKNKKLEFKYSKLVMSANKEDSLPAADSCAILEGEELEGEGEEPEDDVLYSRSSLLAKLKVIATKGNRQSSEAVQLKSSQPERWVWG
ncbi:endosome/lysosome-associated apoptosis and autophagy regulator family member 2 isoform X2 [Brachyhypopomus gauderio]